MRNRHVVNNNRPPGDSAYEQQDPLHRRGGSTKREKHALIGSKHLLLVVFFVVFVLLSLLFQLTRLGPDSSTGITGPIKRLARLRPVDALHPPLSIQYEQQPTTPTEETLGFDPSTSPPFVIFYNIYVAPKNIEKGIHIVQEQLGQIGRSHATSWKDRRPTIYYNTIGAPALNATYMNELCSQQNLICKKMRHYESAFEEVTLQRLYNFCTTYDTNSNNESSSSSSSSSFRVVYMHNKGSFNDRDGQNEIWRRHMTAAVTTKYCLQPPDDSCNVCGLNFWPQWTTMMPGNFWSAKCSYVKTLLPPVGFDTNMKQLSEQVLHRNETGQLSILLFPAADDQLGLGRFATEHWIASHPHVQPCDLSETMDIHYWNMQMRQPSDMKWSMAPRAPLQGPWTTWPGATGQSYVLDRAGRLKEYYLLPGYLFKWVFLYNQVPGNDSWAWSTFPDGQLWKKKAARYGTNVIDVPVTDDGVTD
jgi:hypothetical protein